MSLSYDSIKEQRLLMLIEQCRRIALDLPNTETAQQLLNLAAEHLLLKSRNKQGSNRRATSENSRASCKLPEGNA